MANMKIKALLILAIVLAGCSVETPEDVNEPNKPVEVAESHFIYWKPKDSNEYYVLDLEDLKDLTDQELNSLMSACAFSNSTWGSKPEDEKAKAECYRRLLPKRYWRSSVGCDEAKGREDGKRND